ncbi:MAG: ComF family protein [Clostridia bacterium]|nr:ComF family protein [Clostridia bacterium]
MNRSERLRTELRHAFFPFRCCVCGRVLHAGNEICEECISAILKVPPTGFCRGCGRPMKKCMCIPEPFLSAAAAPFLFEGDVREQIHKFKFENKPFMALSYAKIAAKYIHDCGIADGAQLLTFIPMTQKAIKMRGYNQAREFAVALSNILHIECEQTLVKYCETPSQHDLSAFLRHGNLTGVYTLPPDKENLIRDKVILLADDITTTGSTLHEAAKTLLIFGAKEVRGVCIARAPAQDQMIL